MSSSNAHRSHPNKPVRRPALLPVLIVFIILLMAASAVLIFLVRNHLAASTGAGNTIHLSAQNGFDCEFSEAQQLYPFGEGVLKVTATRVAYLSLSGAEIYGTDVTMNEPFCVTNNDYALIADSGGFFCSLFNPKGEIYRVQTKGAISFASLSMDGQAGLIIEEPDTKGAIYLLDEKGNFVAQWNSVESGYPVAMAFAPSGDRVDISLVDTDGSSMQPHLKQIRLPEAGSSVKAEDLAIYSPEVSSILANISYIGSDLTVLSGSSDLLSFNNGKINYLKGAYAQIFSVFSLDNAVAVVYTEGIGKKVQLESVGPTFTRGVSLDLGDIFVDAATRSGKILMAVDNRILKIDAATLGIEADTTVDEKILKVNFIDDTRVIVVTDSGVRELKL